MATAATFFLPAIHEHPTGGNLYNRRLIRELQERMPTDVRVYGGEPLAAGRNPTPGCHVGLVDSLLVHDIDDFAGWAEQLDVDRLVLLVHYLDLLDSARGRPRKIRREHRHLSLFHGFVTTSRYVKRRLREESLPSDCIRTVRPGLGAGFRTPVTFDSAEPLRILTVASVLPGKGLMEGVEVLTSISDVDWRWEIVGDDSLDPEYAERVRRRVADTTARRRIDLVGPVDANEIVSRYDAADLFFLPSRFETCSMVTMEAMARGLPVVAYDVGALSELIDDTSTGYLIEDGDLRAAADRIRLLTNDDRRRRMGRAALAAGRTFDRWSEAADRIYRFLQEI